MLGTSIAPTPAMICFWSLYVVVPGTASFEAVTSTPASSCATWHVVHRSDGLSGLPTSWVSNAESQTPLVLPGW